MQGYLLGHATYLGSHVAMKNGRSNMAHLMGGLYISNARRSTISRNNNTTYFEPSIFVYVHVHFVIPLTNVWQLFTLRSNLSSKSFLTSAQRSAEVRALQCTLSFYISICLLGYVCLQFVVYASLILDWLPFRGSKDFNSINCSGQSDQGVR